MFQFAAGKLGILERGTGSGRPGRPSFAEKERDIIRHDIANMYADEGALKSEDEHRKPELWWDIKDNEGEWIGNSSNGRSGLGAEDQDGNWTPL